MYSVLFRTQLLTICKLYGSAGVRTWMQPKCAKPSRAQLSCLHILDDDVSVAQIDDDITVKMNYTLACVSYPDGGLIAEDFINGEPGGQIQHVLQNLLIKLQVGELALPF